MKKFFADYVLRLMDEQKSLLSYLATHAREEKTMSYALFQPYIDYVRDAIEAAAEIERMLDYIAKHTPLKSRDEIWTESTNDSINGSSVYSILHSKCLKIQREQTH